MIPEDQITYVSEAHAPIVHAKRRTLVSSLVGLSKLDGRVVDEYVHELLAHSGLAENITFMLLDMPDATSESQYLEREGKEFVDEAYAVHEPLRFDAKAWKAIALRIEYFGAHSRYHMGVRRVRDDLDPTPRTKYAHEAYFWQVEWVHTEFETSLSGSPATRTWGAAYVCAAYYMYGLYLANAGAFWRINRTIRFEGASLEPDRLSVLVGAAARTTESLRALRASLKAVNAAFLDLDTAHTQWLYDYYEVLPINCILRELDIDATGADAEALFEAWNTLRSLLVSLGLQDAGLTFGHITLAPTREEFHRVTTQLRDWHNDNLKHIIQS